MKLLVFMKTLAFSAMLLTSGIAQSATYYVDPSSTSSSANGSLASPWKTLSQVSSNMSLFQPGDFILFKRGQSFQGTLTITRSGTAGNPITFGAYGTGADPLFWGTGATISSLFYMYNRAYITFYGLNISDTTISETDRTVQSKIQRAFQMDGSTNNVILRKCRLDRVGVGAYFVGPNNMIDSCDIGNMRMVRNTPTSVNPDDDYGANPVVISSANNTIINNYFHDCWAISYDYRFDGGAIEFYGDGSSNNFVGYNTFIDCNGVAESGSGSGGSITGNIFAYNKMINNGSLFYVNNGGNFAVTVTNMQFLNNVIVENVVNRLLSNHLASMRSTSTLSGIAIFKNNVFWLTSGIDVAKANYFTGSQLIHEDNIYKLGNNSVLNFTANSNELVTTSNTIFTNSTPADPTAWNYQPSTGSPAIDFGQAVGLAKDFLGNPVPSSSLPDAGIIEVPSGTGLRATAVAGSISCNGGTTTVVVSATGGTAPYTGTGNFTVSAGSHSYTVTDANGNTSNTSVVVSQPAAISATVSTGTIQVNGGTTTVTVTASGGTGALSYRLNNGTYQSSNTFNSVAAGNHSITVRDANGCTLSRNFTITQPAPPALAASSTAGTISCNGGSANVTVSASGGTAPYTGTGTFTVTAGTYTYTVTDANGASASTSITVTQPNLLNATISAGTINVNGGTASATINAFGGTPSYSYRINNGAYQSSNVITGIAAGTHSITIRDANGCTSVKSLTLTQPAVLSASSTSTSITCAGGNSTVTVSATGGLTPYTGTGTFTVVAGSHQFTVTDAGGATTTTSITITEPAAITATVTSGTITVNGGTTNVTVNAAGGTGTLRYRINGGAYQNSNVFSNIPAGTHTIMVRDANACTRSVSVTISEPAVLTATAIPGNISCNGGSTNVVVSATGGTAPYTGTGTFSVSAGTYNYTVTDASGSTASTSVIIVQPSAIAVSVSTGSITSFGGTTTVQVNATGGTGTSYSYKLNSGSYQTTNSFNNVPAGNHSVTVRDANGCTSVKNFTITQPANNPIVANASSTGIACFGGTATVTVSATGGTAPYVGVGSFTVTSGTYNYTVQDANGNSTVASITIAQPAQLTATVSTGTINIYGGTTSATVNASGGTIPYSYRINGGTYQSSNVFTGVVAGNHTIVIRDANGCTTTRTITLTQPDGLVVTATSTASILCSGGSGNVTVSATGGLAPYTGTGTFSVGAGTHSFTVTDAAGASATRTITVSAPTQIEVNVNTEVISLGETTTTATIEAIGGTGSYTYSIDGSPFQTSNIFVGITIGDHMATVLDQNGCTRTENFAVALSLSQTLNLSLVTKSNVTCRGGSNGMIEVLGMAGVAPYTYSINNGRFGTGNIFKNLQAGTYRVTVKDAQANVADLVVTIFDGRRQCLGTGISGRVSLSAYPNPTVDYFNLTIASEDETDVNVEVFNMEGKAVHLDKGSFDKVYRFGQNFRSGTYIIKVTQGKNVETIKVVKGQ